VVAWYHGDRGQQRVSGAELAILSALLALGGGALWLYSQRNEQAPVATAPPTAPTAAQGSPAASADERPSIAVLPFENRSAKEDDVFFVDGIHDDILTQLSKVSALKVISRTSVEKFRDTQLSTKEIAGQLGVKSILEGGVQRAGDRVRINVQLIDADSDAHLWAESYDRELTAANIFAIQSEVAAAIAGALKATLTAGEQARIQVVPTQNLQAWQAYQLGSQRMAKRTSAGLADAERFFRRAINLDPGFALAHAALADTLVLQIGYSDQQSRSALAEAGEAASRALELDANLAEAWAARGLIAREARDSTAEEDALRRAVTLNPNYAPAQHWLSMTLTDTDRFDEALAHAERAVQLDPLSGIVNNWLGVVLEVMGRSAEAEKQYRKVIEIDPSMPIAYQNLASLYADSLNRFDLAVPAMERAIALDPGDPSLPCLLALRKLELGADAEAIRLVTEALKRWSDQAVVNSIAGDVFAVLGDSALAEGHARKAMAISAKYSYGAIEVLRNADLVRKDYATALRRYETAHAELFGPSPAVHSSNLQEAIGVALVLQRMGEPERAADLVDRAERVLRSLPQGLPVYFGFLGAQIHALRGDSGAALNALRQAERAGARSGWRYARDIDPAFESIRDDPEFKAVFADIERDMARQRAELAKRPKDAPLDLGVGE
jgi:TolB-like protein/Tfp pilus assembly protein PilF